MWAEQQGEWADWTGQVKKVYLLQGFCWRSCGDITESKKAQVAAAGSGGVVEDSWVVECYAEKGVEG